MKHLATSCLRLLSAGALIALPLAACNNEEGQARNDAEKRLEAAAKQIQAISLQPAYPTPMTDEQTDALATLAQRVAANERPPWMSDEQAVAISALNERFKPIETHKSDLQEVETGLAGRASGLSAQQSAHASLRADANLGLARVRLEEAERSETKMGHEISLAGAHIDSILDLHAIIAAVSKYDPAAPLREIDSQAQDARSRLSRFQSEVRDLQKRLGDLKARVDAQVRETNRLGEEAARRRESARTAPLDRRIALTEEAAGIARQADAHQVNAAQLESQVDVLQPDLVRAQTFVLQAEGELKDLDAARARIKARQDSVAEEGRSLQSDLRGALESFNEVHVPLTLRFDEQLMPRFERAREAAEAGVREARGAGSDGAGRLATAQQVLSQVLWRQAMSIEQFAQLVRRVAENGQALGRSGQDAAAADALDARAKAAREAAAEVLGEALGAVEGAGRSEEERTRNAQLAELIRDSLEYITGQAVAEVRDLTDVGAITPMEEDIPAVGAGESPLGLLRNAKAVLEGGRLEAIPGLFYAKNPGQQAWLDMVKRVLGAAAKLDSASRNQFGVGLVEIGNDPRFATELNRLTAGMGGGGINWESNVEGNPLDIAGFADIGDLGSIDLDSIEFMYDNSRTTAWTDDMPALEGQNFVLVDGQWYFEADELPEEMGTFMNMFLNPVISAVENTADRTSRGEFVDQWLMVSSLLEEIGRLLEEEMRKMMPSDGGMFEGFDPSKFVDPSRGGGGN